MNSALVLVLALAVALLALAFTYRLLIRILGMVIIPNNGVGIVTKKFGLGGKTSRLPDGKIIALAGEAGIQADTLAPGLHFWLWPWQYSVSTVGFVTIDEGKIGVVEARDGVPLSEGHVLGKRVDCDSYQNARAFLQNGGQRGTQIAVIPPGTYRVNTALFTVSEAPVLEISENRVGIVTTKEGKSLPAGEIAGSTVDGHNSFQDGDAFVRVGGFKGLQEQVLLAGRYFINPEFATVETVEMTEVPIAHAGVVIAYVGEPGEDVTGESFKHGNLVQKGKKGVWAEPLDPGRYAINPRTHRVENVPTANVVLNWATGKTEAHKLDEKLSTITVRSSDGFKFNLDVSQIIHIPRNDAPKVIARFGSMVNLVTQVLEPTIGNYFRNAAQSSDVIEFLKSRSDRQADAKRQIGDALEQYNVGAVDTLIGDIVPPDDLMKTLTDRKIAEQERVTYETQRQAEIVRKELEQARAVAATQAKVVDSERSVAIAEFAAQAAIKKSEGEAKAKTTIAEADASVTKLVGFAEAEKTQKIGLAEADVIKQKVNATNAESFVAIEVARALASSGQRLVPEIVAGGSGSGSNLVEMLMASMIKDVALKGVTIAPAAPKT
ncbi:SPFH domain / band 7 family protein [mine drainage metagenome]|uniref:SPFH domain / band 7 family protein n=1 Tax=mine drainage metagenome TaxID=410659 RepID=A0A1J5T401_9ZZZZ